jgi:Flp pilus assembly protein TadG
MTSKLRLLLHLKNQRGVSAILVAIVLFVLLGFAALAIDLGYLFATRNELQNTADAAALAATRRLGEIYQAMPTSQQPTYDLGDHPGDKTSIATVATNVAGENKAAGESMAIQIEDIQIGQWDFVNRILTVTDAQPDAVRVTARREEGSVMGPISTFFARIFGIDAMNVNAVATAALSGLGETTEGELELPIGISHFWFNNPEWCDDTIKFSPTKDPDACAGWTAFTYNPNDANLRKILQEDPNLESPATIAGDTEFNFIGGDLSQNTFDELLMLFKDKGYDVDQYGNPVDVDSDGNPDPGAKSDGYVGTVDGEERATVPLTNEAGERLYYPDDNKDPTPRNKHVWKTKVVVYGWEDCSNPNTTITIVGYAPIELTDVVGAPEKLVQGKVTCGEYSSEDLRGGGAYAGIKGTIPGLVE